MQTWQYSAMPSETKPDPRSGPRYLIVEVDGFEGDHGSIVVTNDRAPRQGLGDKLYCLGVLDSTGVVRFVDWGYATIEEAREASGNRASPT